MLAVGDIQVGRFILHVASVEPKQPNQWGAQTLQQEYYLVLVSEKRNNDYYYVSLFKDARFEQFKPRALPTELRTKERPTDPEHDYYLNNNNQQMPLWKLHRDKLQLLIFHCEAL